MPPPSLPPSLLPDTYTEVDKMHFNFLNQYRTWAAPAN
jgi:hypothetical protein